MSKLLLIVVILVVAAWLYRRHLLAARPRQEPPRPTAAGRETTMVRCAACGVFVPEAETRREGQRHLCPKHN